VGSVDADAAVAGLAATERSTAADHRVEDLLLRVCADEAAATDDTASCGVL
jgi:hypothetical protein